VPRCPLVVLGVVLALAAPAAAADPSDRVHAADGRFADDRGGQWLLRGGNVIHKPTGEPVISQRDVEVMRELGWTTIRLGTGWRWFEPAEGVYDEAYADRFAAIAKQLTGEGFRVIVDMHQDAWGPPVGNGAPRWAAPQECEAAHVPLSQPTGAWAADYFSPRTICAFTRFWLTPELQDHLIEAYRMIARRLRDDRRFVGIDLFNEPFNGALAPGVFEHTALFPFYDRAAEAIRDVAPDAIAFEEPAISKTVTGATMPSLPDGPGRAWAPHVYGLWDLNTSSLQRRDEAIEVSMRSSGNEARIGERPLWFGEFGIFNGADGAETSMSLIYDLADELHAGTAVWELDDPHYGPMAKDGSLIVPRARTLARAYPLRVGGDLVRVEFDDATSELTVGWTQRPDAGRTVIVLPPLRYDAKPEVAAGEGVKVTRRGGGRLELSARPGPAEVTVRPPSGV
jgi:endoglycosylceramidase